MLFLPDLILQNFPIFWIYVYVYLFAFYFLQIIFYAQLYDISATSVWAEKNNNLSGVGNPFSSHPCSGMGIQSRFYFSYTLHGCYSSIWNVTFILENQNDAMHHALEV